VTTHSPALPWLLGIGLLSACSSVEGPVAYTSEPGITASEPVVNRAAAQSVVSASASTADGVSYVSLQPSTVLDGETATITNTATGVVLVTGMVEGGFDPVPIAANAGDSLDIVVHGPGGSIVHMMTAIVPPHIPPIIVRSDPPKKKRDIPLNITPFIVFSEPMDPSTINGETVRLWLDGQSVQGSVTLTDDGLRVLFDPAEDLRPDTTYVLWVSRAAADGSGDGLEEQFAGEFTTVAVPPTPASITLTPATATIAPGTTVQLKGTVTDQDGNDLSGHPISWSSSDLSSAWVDAVGTVTAKASGAATITATVEGVIGTATIRVEPATFAWVSAGAHHTCAQTTTGSLYCWGDNKKGHLGYGPRPVADCPAGTMFGNTACSRRPGLVPIELGLTALSAGAGYRCGLVGSTAYCWGWNDDGELGHGTTTFSQRPVRVSGDLGFASISASWHSCGVTVSGAAYCWGVNDVGAIGDGSTTDRLTPVPVSGGLAFATVSVSWYHTCGVTTDGNIYCWGSNTSGQLGVPDTDESCRSSRHRGQCSTRPMAVKGLDGHTFVSVTTGTDHTCGLTTGGAAYCWGGNNGGQLGDGTTTQRWEPAPVSGGLAFTAIAAGGYGTCGLTTDGSAFCWGQHWGTRQEHGGFDSLSHSEEPEPVAGGLSFSTLSMSRYHVCGLTSDGNIYCWGDSRFGQIGDGWDLSRAEPVPVPAAQ